MNNTNNPFKKAQIEILDLGDFDVITASPTGPGAFEGEEEEFYWDR